MKVDVILRNVEFPDDFQPPENFDYNNRSNDNKCCSCPFYFPGEDWVDHFCRLETSEDRLNDIFACPLNYSFKG